MGATCYFRSAKYHRYQVEELRKIQCIAELPTPLDAKKLKHFFGLASYSHSGQQCCYCYHATEHL